MTGLGTGLIVSLSAFLLGVLSMHWTADHLLLWQSPITHLSLLSAHAYYSHTYGINHGGNFPSSTLIRTTTPQQVATVREQGIILHLAWAFGCLLIFIKIFVGRRQSNWLFDGASFFLYGSCTLVYFTKILFNLSHLPPLTPLPHADPQNPHDATLLPLRELATSHAVLAAALIGVIVLQSGQYYSERLEERERIEEEEARLARRRRRLLTTSAGSNGLGVEKGLLKVEGQ